MNKDNLCVINQNEFNSLIKKFENSELKAQAQSFVINKETSFNLKLSRQNV